MCHYFPYFGYLDADSRGKIRNDGGLELLVVFGVELFGDEVLQTQQQHHARQSDLSVSNTQLHGTDLSDLLTKLCVIFCVVL
jgi:hypothetical protein